MISKLKERRSEEQLSRKGSQAKGGGAGSPAPTQLQVCRETLLHVPGKAALPQHEQALEGTFLSQKVAMLWQTCPITYLHVVTQCVMMFPKEHSSVRLP